MIITQIPTISSSYLRMYTGN